MNVLVPFYSSTDKTPEPLDPNYLPFCSLFAQVNNNASHTSIGTQTGGKLCGPAHGFERVLFKFGPLGQKYSCLAGGCQVTITQLVLAQTPRIRIRIVCMYYICNYWFGSWKGILALAHFVPP